MTSSLTFCSIVCWFQWFSCFWGEAFFCGVGVLLKPRDYSDYLISCPVWSNFFPHWAWVPERKYCKLPSDFESWKGPAWWEAPASSSLHWKGSAAWVQTGKNKERQKDHGSLTFSLNMASFWTQKLREIIAQFIALKRCIVILKIRWDHIIILTKG